MSVVADRKPGIGKDGSGSVKKGETRKGMGEEGGGREKRDGQLMCFYNKL